MPSKCTVSGNLQVLTGGAIPQGQLTFELINVTPGQMPQVSGTSILPVLRQVVQTAPDGSFSVAIWGNDNIVPPVTNYAITLSDGNGTYLGPLIFTISGGTVNLNSATPTGANVISGAYTFTALETFTAGISADGTHILTLPAVTATLATTANIAANVVTIIEKLGSGAGNYTTTSASYSDIDGTNLSTGSVTVPTGWKATITISGAGFESLSGGASSAVAITDGTTVLRETSATNNDITAGFTAQKIFTGDGAAHTFKMRFKSDGTNTLTIVNSSATLTPTMVVRIEPAN